MSQGSLIRALGQMIEDLSVDVPSELEQLLVLDEARDTLSFLEGKVQFQAKQLQRAHVQLKQLSGQAKVTAAREAAELRDRVVSGSSKKSDNT